MTVKEYMVDLIKKIAADNRYGYSNDWPNNKFGEGNAPYDGDCGALQSYVLNQGLKQIGINTNEYFEPQGSSMYNEAYLLKYCNRYNFSDTRNQVGDILVSAGHTVMVTALGANWLQDTVTHASMDRDGKSGDSSGREVCSQQLWDGGWKYIYRLKDQYNKELTPTEEKKKEQKQNTQSTPIQLLQAAIDVWSGKYGNLTYRKTQLTNKFGSKNATRIQELVNLSFYNGLNPTNLLKAAIDVCNGTYGVNPTRKSKLVAKFGTAGATKIQELVNLAFK